MNKQNQKLMSIMLVFIFIFSSIYNVNVFAEDTINIVSNIDDFKITNIEYTDIYKGDEHLHGRENVNLEWNPIDFQYSSGNVPDTVYYLARRKINPDDSTDTTGDYQWKLRGNYNIDEIKVLNLYPGKKREHWDGNFYEDIDADNFKDWMNNVQAEFPNSPSNIVADAVDIVDFNKNPSNYLYKDSKGSYNYDAVVFGFWDSNNRKDISNTGADIIQDYINNGYGVVFGHDTVQHSSPDGSGKIINPNFIKLVENNTSTIIAPSDKNAWHYSDKITIVQQSTANTFPFDITGYDLVIPKSHTVNQLPTKDSNIYMRFEKNYFPADDPNVPYYQDGSGNSKMGDGTYEYNGKTYQANAYLTIDYNTTLIQTGHSNGQSTIAEQAVLANTLYSVILMIRDVKAVDRIFDTSKPMAPTPSIYNDDNSKLIFNAEDVGSQYKYRVIAQPQGYGKSVAKYFDNIKPYLDSNETQSTLVKNLGGEENLFVISPLENTIPVKSEIKGSHGDESDVYSFEYYIDTNPVGERRDENSGTKYIEYGTTYDIKTVLNGYTEGQYLHIWSYDNANNLSINGPTSDVGSTSTENGIVYTTENGITNVELWTTKPFYDVTVKHIDENGTALLVPTTSSYMLGETFSSIPATIEGYQYNSSLPNTSIVVSDPANDPNINTITHMYNKLYTNNVYTVKHDNLGDLDHKTKIEQIHSENNILNSSYIVNVPSYENYNFTGYESIDDSSYSGETGIIGNTYTHTVHGNEDIYLHYVQKEGYPEIVIQRKNEDGTYTELTRYSEPSNSDALSNTVVVSGSDILNHYNTNFSDIDAYINGHTLINDISVLINKENANVYTLTLIPRTKQVKYYGVRYLDKESDELLTLHKVYNGTDLTEMVYVDAVDLSIWHPFEKTVDRVIDYTQSTDDIIMMGYYNINQGLPINYNYTYTQQYINTLDSSELATSDYYSGSTTSPASIHYKEFSEVDIDGVDHKIDFQLDYVEVYSTEPNSTVYKFSDDGRYLPITDIFFYVPEIDENGFLLANDYIVKVYYKPNTFVHYNEYISNSYIDNNGDTQTEYIQVHSDVIQTQYNESVTLTRTRPEDLYTIEKIEVDGVEVSNFDFEVLSDTYDKEVNVYYKQKTYDLEVRYIDSHEDIVYTTNTHYKIPIDKAITFEVPISYGEFELKNVLAGENTSNNYITWSSGESSISFNPSMTESNTPYVVEVHYNHLAKAKLIYAELVKNTEVITETIYIDTYLGNVHSYTVPDRLSDDFEVAYAYLDGVRYEPKENEIYDITIKNIDSTLLVVYKPIAKYKVTVDTNPKGLGTTFGNINENGDQKLFIDNEQVTLTVTIDEGYILKNWTVEPSDLYIKESVVYGENNTYSGYFNIPHSDVTIIANIEKITIPKYNVHLNVTPSDSGTIVSNKDSLAYEYGENVSLTAKAKSGYTFKKWVVDSDNLELTQEDLLNRSLSFDMINYDVSLTAIFEESSTGGGSSSGGGSNIKPEVPTEPIKPDIPTEPIYPENPTSITDFVSNPVQKEIRKYMPYINGYDTGEVKPDKPINRIEVIQAIYNLYGNDYIADQSILDNYDDVEQDQWYSNALAFAFEFELVKGFDDNNYKPYSNITRAQFATIVAKLIDTPSSQTMSIFNDTKDHWAEESIDILYTSGITKGYPDGSFKPDKSISRAEFVTMVNRLVNRYNDYTIRKTFIDLDETHWAYDNLMNASNGGDTPYNTILD